MTTSEIIALLQKKDISVKKYLFQTYYGKLAAIARRYCKSQTQADEALNVAFYNCLNKLAQQRQAKNLNLSEFLEKEFIVECITFVKNIRSEYYVSSTVHATGQINKNYNLFENQEWIDFNQVDVNVIIKSMQQMVPSQRLVFNIHIIDGISLSEAAIILESSEETVKSNLEKARFNLQKNIESNLKSLKV